jgi:hypothetical protein
MDQWIHLIFIKNLLIYLKHDINLLIKLSLNTTKFTRGLDTISHAAEELSVKSYNAEVHKFPSP